MAESHPALEDAGEANKKTRENNLLQVHIPAPHQGPPVSGCPEAPTGSSKHIQGSPCCAGLVRLRSAGLPHCLPWQPASPAVPEKTARFSLVLGMCQRASRAWAGGVVERMLGSGSSCSFCEGHSLPITGIHSARPITKSLTIRTVFGTETNTAGSNCRTT